MMVVASTAAEQKPTAGAMVRFLQCQSELACVHDDVVFVEAANAACGPSRQWLLDNQHGRRLLYTLYTYDVLSAQLVRLLDLPELQADATSKTRRNAVEKLREQAVKLARFLVLAKAKPSSPTTVQYVLQVADMRGSLEPACAHYPAPGGPVDALVASCFGRPAVAACGWVLPLSRVVDARAF
jgi:hypothetical protein